MPDRARPWSGEPPPRHLTSCYDRLRQALRRPLELGLYASTVLPICHCIGLLYRAYRRGRNRAEYARSKTRRSRCFLGGPAGQGWLIGRIAHRRSSGPVAKFFRARFVTELRSVRPVPTQLKIETRAS